MALQQLKLCIVNSTTPKTTCVHHFESSGSGGDDTLTVYFQSHVEIDVAKVIGEYTNHKILKVLVSTNTPSDHDDSIPEILRDCHFQVIRVVLSSSSSSSSSPPLQEEEEEEVKVKVEPPRPEKTQRQRQARKRRKSGISALLFGQ